MKAFKKINTHGILPDMARQSRNDDRLILWLRRSLAVRLIFLVSFDSFCIFFAYYLAYWLRLDSIFPISEPRYTDLLFRSAPTLIGLRVLANWLWRQYHWSFSHADLPEALNLFFSALCGSATFIAINYFTQPFGEVPPRSIYALEFFLSLLLMALLRFAPKYLYHIYCGFISARYHHTRPTLIYGAGGNAELLVRDLSRTTDHPYHLVGFVDDAPSKRHVYISGLKVLGSIDDLPTLITRYDIRELFITIADFSGAPLRRLMDMCEPFGIRYKIVPPYQTVLTEQLNVLSALKEIKPEALINRPPIPFEPERLANFCQGRVILVTGAAGSIGSEICFQLASYGVAGLILFDIDENSLFFLWGDLTQKYSDLAIDFEIGSIRDESLLKAVMTRYRPDSVIHAAAHKHVPLMEHCPLAAIKNNVLGTLFTARAALAAGVEHFLLISTDKAVDPSSVMGATKRLAEIILQNLRSSTMRSIIVRFGNVLGSNGSLLPIIQRQIQRGGPVTITDPKMTRFFMTIPEAIGLVLTTLTLSPQNTFVLEMGEPVSIDKLVRHVISLSGLAPERDIEIVYTQKRPGEKLTENLISAREVLEPTEHQGIRAFNQAPVPLDLDQLTTAINSLPASSGLIECRKFLATFLPEYRP